VTFTTDADPRDQDPPAPAERVLTIPRQLGSLSRIRIPLPRVASSPLAGRPRLRQLIGVCGWAAVLGGISLIVAIRGIWGSITTNPPGWYQPSVTLVGLIGIALTVGSFATVERRRTPWTLLSAATAFLIAAMTLTVNAF
jgi:hypothetical protein